VVKVECFRNLLSTTAADKVNPHLSWVVVGAFAVGALLGIVVMLNKNLRLLSQIRRLQKQHDIASKEIVNLRAIPINDVP